MSDRLIRVDMTTQTASVEPYPEQWKLLGGRALSARILKEECNPTCEPLESDNVLVLAPGVLSGTSAPTSGRLGFNRYILTYLLMNTGSTFPVPIR